MGEESKWDLGKRQPVIAGLIRMVTREMDESRLEKYFGGRVQRICGRLFRISISKVSDPSTFPAGHHQPAINQVFSRLYLVGFLIRQLEVLSLRRGKLKRKMN